MDQNNGTIVNGVFIAIGCGLLWLVGFIGLILFVGEAGHGYPPALRAFIGAVPYIISIGAFVAAFILNKSTQTRIGIFIGMILAAGLYLVAMSGVL